MHFAMRLLSATVVYFAFLLPHSHCLVQLAAKKIGSEGELVFVHIPHNHGHTIEKVASFGNGPNADVQFGSHFMSGSAEAGDHPGGTATLNELGLDPSKTLQLNKLDVSPMLDTQKYAHVSKRKETWGALDSRLMATSSVGCPLYMTPPKLWPNEAAEAYFGNKTRFGLIQDPLERLVNFFQSSIGGETWDSHGGQNQWAKTCDVDSAISAMMKNYIKNRYRNPYSSGCAFLPQTDYVEGKYGISIPVDSRRFPSSVNSLLSEWGYQFEIQHPDIFRATGCPETRSALVRPSTVALVKMVYKRDYDFLCNTFGHCGAED